MLKSLRTKEDLKNYFKAMGQNITEKEISALKKIYTKVEGGSKLTMQELDDISGGFYIVNKKGVYFFGTGFLSRYNRRKTKTSKDELIAIPPIKEVKIYDSAVVKEFKQVDSLMKDEHLTDWNCIAIVKDTENYQTAYIIPFTDKFAIDDYRGLLNLVVEKMEKKIKDLPKKIESSEIFQYEILYQALLQI